VGDLAMARGHGLACVGEAEVVHVHDEREVLALLTQAMALRRSILIHTSADGLVQLFLANVVVTGCTRTGRPAGGVATEIRGSADAVLGTYRGSPRWPRLRNSVRLSTTREGRAERRAGDAAPGPSVDMVARRNRRSRTTPRGTDYGGRTRSPTVKVA
jgi:hypothetical protein